MTRLVIQPQSPPSESTSRAVGEASVLLLSLALAGLIAVCVLVIIALRRRSGARSARAKDRGAPADAWQEAANRVPLEDGEDIPREPGTG